MRTVRESVLPLRPGVDVGRATAALYQAFKVSAAEIAGRSPFAINGGARTRSERRRLLEALPPGGRFCDEFEAAAALLHARPRPMSTTKARARLRVLVVDDNVEAAESCAMLLEVTGREVRVAHDGPTALEIARTWRPDVVLLDITLQGMDGYEVARRMRAVPDLRAVCLVAVTGHGQESDRRRSRAAGFDHHLVKPVTLRMLDSVLGSAPPPA